MTSMHSLLPGDSSDQVPVKIISSFNPEEKASKGAEGDRDSMLTRIGRNVFIRSGNCSDQ